MLPELGLIRLTNPDLSNIRGLTWLHKPRSGSLGLSGPVSIQHERMWSRNRNQVGQEYVRGSQRENQGRPCSASGLWRLALRCSDSLLWLKVTQSAKHYRFSDLKLDAFSHITLFIFSPSWCIHFAVCFWLDLFVNPFCYCFTFRILDSSGMILISALHIRNTKLWNNTCVWRTNSNLYSKL